VPDKWPSAKSLFAVKFFSEGSLPRAALGKAFAEGFWAFAECPGPSAKRAPPVVHGLFGLFLSSMSVIIQNLLVRNYELICLT